MVALKTLGVICLILVCFGPVTALIIDVYSKNKPSVIKKDGKRELKINRVSYWDYLVIIFPIALLLIGLFSPDPEEKSASFLILGFGYMFLILSPYNRRIDIPTINLFLLSISMLIAIAGYSLQATNRPINPYSDFNNIKSLNTLYCPILSFMYLHCSRYMIKLLTKTYPITLDRNFRLGHFHNRYNRKANLWDLAWTIVNLSIVPLSLMFLANWIIRFLN